ncbi:unnamed protein product [Closterium sp. Naga37s-1]|nr:unnamed protein product [Closterium sp. Naga37s-1]
MAQALRFVCLLALCLAVSAKVYFEEKFDDTWQSRWVVSDWKKSEGAAGEWKHAAGKYYKDPEDKGIQTHPDARFFAISSKIEEFDNKDKDLVLQFQVKHEQDLDCGGGYIKLLEGEVDQKNFGGDTPYSIMFGPDICGYSTKRVHAIITHEGKNMLIKKNVECETDTLSHVYTFILSPNNTYKILIDNVEKSGGDIFAEWDFLKPRQIPDKSVKKPEDWVDDEYMDDPEDKKPDGWDDIAAEIVDPEAKKPEDWNDEDDGEWEAPLIPNPEYKGEWKPKRIKNPAYKGKWKPPMIDNPDFVEKPEAYRLPPLRYAGFEIWQVKAGSIFDNILVTDDAEYARKFAEDTWGAMKAEEKKMHDEAEKSKEEEEKEDDAGDDDADDEDDAEADAEAAEAAEDKEDAEEAKEDAGHDEL